MNKKQHISILVSLLLLLTLLPFITSADADDTHIYLKYYTYDNTQITDADIGQNIYLNLTATTVQAINTWQFQYFNFTSGIINCKNITQDTFFDSTFMNEVGTINNDTGVIGGSWVDYTWESASGGTSTNGTTNRTVVQVGIVPITCGDATFSINSVGDVEFGMGGGEVEYTFHSSDITIHAQAPQSFDVTADGISSVDLSWTKGTGATHTIIRGRQDAMPTNITNGSAVCNVTGSSFDWDTPDEGENWHFKAWSYNSTEHTFSTQNSTDSLTLGTNDPPTFGTPSPTNGTTGLNLSFTWEIPINDPDGDSFDWTIQCNNSNTSSGSSASNGTKQLSLNGLTYNTTYTVWVNATDGEYTRAWYTFETKALGFPNPPSTFTATADGRFEIDLSWGSKGDESDRTIIEWNTSAKWPRGSGTALYNGTGSSTNHTSLTENTRYYYQVWGYNETDSTFSLTNNSDDATTDANNEPVISSPSPANGISNVDITTTQLSATINDPEGDTFNWTIETSPDVGSNSANGASNGSKTCSISGLSHNTLYTWYVNVTDGYEWENTTYTFTTRTQYTPIAPQSFSATMSNATQILTSWNHGTNSDYVYVAYNSSGYPSDRTDANELLTNETGTSETATGLTPHQTYYFTAWGYNVTDNVWSSTSQDSATTGNTELVYGTPSPSNGSSSQPLSLFYNISITDPDSDLLTWSIECSNGQTNNAAGASGGIKSLTLSGLTYNTEYTVFVNATDGYLAKSEWFTFTTASNNALLMTSESPTSGTPGIALNLIECTIHIADPNGDNFDWWINGSFLTNAHGSSSTNGTKAATVTSTLNYNTTYTWYVNATDGTAWTNNSYTFTTIVNSTPVISGIDPIDNAINVDVDIGELEFTINDAEGDLMDWSLTLTPGINAGSDTSDTNGTNTVSITTLSYSTEYTWQIHVTDGITWNNQSYTFTTVPTGCDNPNPPSAPSPSNGITGINVDVGELSCLVSDPNSDSMTVTFYWGNGTEISTQTNVPSGSTAECNIPTLEFNTTYYWFTIVNDTNECSSNTQSYTWNFTTVEQITELTETPSTIDFGQTNYSTTVTSDYITLNNSGYTDITTIQFLADTMEDTESYYVWNIDDSPGVSKYSLKYQFEGDVVWTPITSSYVSTDKTIVSGNELKFKLRLYMPVISTVNEEMIGELSVRYTGGIQRTLGIDFVVDPSLNESCNEINLTVNEFIAGGTIGSDKYFLTFNDNLTKNTTINLPVTYSAKSWWFFSKTKTTTTTSVYGITKSFTFVKIPITGTAISFKLNIENIDSYYGFVIIPNPGYFQTSQWWFDLLNDASSIYQTGQYFSTW